jgi:hypothetical protein
MGVGIQNETNKLFRQEKYHTAFFDTSAGRIHVEDFEEEIFSERFTDFEERLILEINTPFSDEHQEQRILRIDVNFEEEILLEIFTDFEEIPILEIATPSEEGPVSDDYDYDYDGFLDEDPFFRIDGDVLDQLIRNYHESDDEE